MVHRKDDLPRSEGPTLPLQRSATRTMADASGEPCSRNSASLPTLLLALRPAQDKTSSFQTSALLADPALT